MKNIKEIFLAASILGIALLFIISIFIQPKEISPNEISQKNIDEKIKINGILEKITEKETLSYLKLRETNLTIILFSPKKNLQKELKQNSSLEISGKVAQYKGELQLNVENIKCLSNC